MKIFLQNIYRETTNTFLRKLTLRSSAFCVTVTNSLSIIRNNICLVAQLAETQCAPTGTVCQRSRGSIAWVDR